jgi:hypothetical protein
MCRFDSISYLMKFDKIFKIKFLIFSEKKKINNLNKKLKFEIKSNGKLLNIDSSSFSEFNDFYFLDFNLNLENEERKRILSTLNIFIENEEAIGSCEIVIVKNKEDAEKELKECDSTIKSFQKSLQDKNINSFQIEIINKKLFNESKKRDEFINYFNENF